MARPRSDIAPRIVKAAQLRFLAEGVDGASLRAIAEDAGTSIGMVYYYFPTKDDLFFEVVEETYTGVLAKLAAALDPAAAPGELEARIGRLYRAIGALTDDELLTLRLVVREILVSSKRLGRLIERFQRGHIPLVVTALAEGMSTGHIDAARSFPVIFLSTLALGVVPQIMRRVAGERLPLGLFPDKDAFAEELVHVLFHGIGARPRPEPAPEKPQKAEKPGKLRRGRPRVTPPRPRKT